MNVEEMVDMSRASVTNPPTTPVPTRVGRTRRVWLALGLTLGLGACADDGVGAVDQTIRVAMNEYDFVSDVVPVIRAGETVQFDADNVGRLVHEIQVLDIEARMLGETGHIAPGEQGSVVVRFDEPGVYQMICDVDDHLSLGQRALFEVLTADGDSVVGG